MRTFQNLLFLGFNDNKFNSIIWAHRHVHYYRRGTERKIMVVFPNKLTHEKRGKFKPDAHPDKWQPKNKWLAICIDAGNLLPSFAVETNMRVKKLYTLNIVFLILYKHINKIEYLKAIKRQTLPSTICLHRLATM